MIHPSLHKRRSATVGPTVSSLRTSRTGLWLLALYIAAEGIQGIVTGSRPETSRAGTALTAGTLLLEPPLGIAKRRLGQRLGSAATAREGTKNTLRLPWQVPCSPAWRPTPRCPGGSWTEWWRC
jgi:hypothetical protein